MRVHPLARSFIRAMLDPRRLTVMTPVEQDAIVRFGRRAGLLANLGARTRRAGVDVPALADIFEGAQVLAAEHSRRVNWEMAQLHHLLRHANFPIVVLKGGA